MRINQLADRPGANKNKRRLGRGSASGKGKTAGRGHNGQKSRSGVSIKGFEGGQMPFYRRLPKRGFNNIFRKEYEILNIGQLQKAVDSGRLDGGKAVDEAALKASGLVRGRNSGTRILAQGELTAALQIEVAGASKAAVAAVEKAGGKITILQPKAELNPDGKKAKKKAEREAAQAVVLKAVNKADKKGDKKPEKKAEKKGDKKAENKPEKKAEKKADPQPSESKEPNEFKKPDEPTEAKEPKEAVQQAAEPDAEKSGDGEDSQGPTDV